MDTAVLIFIYRSRTEAIIGESDVYPKYGDFSGAWGPKDENTEDYIYIEGGYIFNNFYILSFYCLYALRKALPGNI